jgi:hypothetical protein
MTIAEIGCGEQKNIRLSLLIDLTRKGGSKGAGNAVFPLILANRNPELVLRAYDYSTHAVKLVQVSTLPPLV